MSHQKVNAHFCGARCSGANGHVNALGLIESSLHNALGYLAIASRICTRHTMLAENCPSVAYSLPSTGVDMLVCIVKWFEKDIAPDENGLSAIVICKAISPVLQSSPVEDDSHGICAKMMTYLETLVTEKSTCSGPM